MAFSERAYRDALGCYATGVTVVTTWSAEEGPVGITVNSFISVSLDPPLILICLNRNRACLADVLARGKFAVNVLGATQVELSRHFASTDAKDWQGIDYHAEDGGCPVITGALAEFQCDIETTYEGGDHMIVVGRVRRFRKGCTARPLVFLRGRYTSLDDET